MVTKRAGVTTLADALFQKYYAYMRGAQDLSRRGIDDFLALSNFLHGSF